MKPTLLIVLFMSILPGAMAQPYIDVVNIKMNGSPDAGIWRRNNISNHYNYWNMSFNAPVVFKKDSSVILFSPSAERWDVSISNNAELPSSMNSLALPVTFVKPLSKKYALTLVAIPRWNAGEDNLFSHSFQMGGAAMLTYKKRPGLQYKLGVYYNGEFSGTFIIPLLGIDWAINEKNNLFGILPGSLVYEHQINHSVYFGATFKAITNSYYAGYDQGLQPKFIRIDDNQLLLYTDLYLNKHLVGNLAAGHSVFRQNRLGIEHAHTKYFFDQPISDDLIFTAAIAYRIRVR